MIRVACTLLALAAIVPTCRASDPSADELGQLMATAARRFVEGLDESKRSQAVFAFDSPERVNWHWIPRPRKGVPIKELSPDQRALAFGLLSTGLSTKGNVKATTIMSLEEILRVDEHGTGPVRDPELYYVSVFGTPGDDAGWGWRVEGHHLALNYTLKGNRVVSATPFMFGSNPAVVRKGPHKGLRNLADIEAPVDALLASMSGDQKKAATVNPVAPDVTTTPNSAKLGRVEPEGIACDQLTPAQRETLAQVVRAYAANFPPPIEALLLRELEESEKSLHFAWYGPADRTKNHAFRIQGPALFIDFNDTQNDVNHIHTFYRGVADDFGPAAGK
ncbi:hypothetical protein OJF2_78100 [Aquisphaera giovannonii]|uniref:DUF3500 domain-containing protein n=1 Tax=Aquisphaera giovannonii TaxID=406548 RepID=A0A5B9WEX8_9BACT|nr:DUF3500 domain-containing protein [Aquisphaera giovannonii]QEH39198.1 hypothetical protein OJF2_78100 [Aquisphaera giovannonii]